MFVLFGCHYSTILRSW